jgi:hypothetical protein
MTSPRPWWIAYPEVWEREQQAWNKIDADFTFADVRIRGSRRRVVRARWTSQPESGPLAMVTEYPVAYPWFPPHVRTRDRRDLTHHHSPDGGLCLLGTHDDWSTSMTAADLIQSQLPRLLAAGRRGRHIDASLAALEVLAPERMIDQYSYAVGVRLLLTDGLTWSPGAYGDVVAHCDHQGEGWGSVTVLALTEHATTDDVGQVAHPTSRAGLKPPVHGAWVRLPHAPSPKLRPERMWQLMLRRLDPDFQVRVTQANLGLILGSPDASVGV